MRIVSLLPSATEIVCALGLQQDLVGRSHECDFPPTVHSLPACTVPEFESGGTGEQINRGIDTLVQRGLSPFRVDGELLAKLNPDVVLSQDRCEACAATFDEVQKAVDEYLQKPVQVLSVAPEDLDGVLLSIERIGTTVGAEHKASKLIADMTRRLNRLQSRTRQLPSPRVVCLEWFNPLMSSGNWFPDLVSVAGGRNQLSEPGQRSPVIGWEQMLDNDPDILLVSPCGYDIQKTIAELGTLSGRKGWNRLRAVQNGRVFLMDGDQYFHRPGPRLVDSAEILTEIFHPGLFEPGHHPSGWIKISDS